MVCDLEGVRDGSRREMRGHEAWRVQGQRKRKRRDSCGWKKRDGRRVADDEADWSSEYKGKG